MVELPSFPKEKTSIFIISGILLYLGSSYLNILKSDSATLGIWMGVLLILIGAIAQIKNWFYYWEQKTKKSS
jgi:hypothetical protein